MPSAWGSLLWFAAIVALIPLTLWLFKRTPLAGMNGPAGAPRLVANLPLAPQQRLVTVEVGQGADRQWLVLGVSAQGIRTLHILPAQAEALGTPAQATPFALLMSRLGTERKAPDAQ